MVGEPSDTLPGYWPPSSSWGCIREWTGLWHLKEMAPQEVSTHQPLPQVTLLFSATEDGTALLVVRPAQGSSVVGERVQSPP